VVSASLIRAPAQHAFIKNVTGQSDSNVIIQELVKQNMAAVTQIREEAEVQPALIELFAKTGILT
jgi:hypothetical protein